MGVYTEMALTMASMVLEYTIIRNTHQIALKNSKEPIWNVLLINANLPGAIFEFYSVVL